jgi:16S rRNA (guanine966-N2)-methyltransferase
VRVIAGTAKGRRLRVPPGRETRPMGDRVREALFSSLTPSLPGAAVLDLWSGSGSLAIEALSRGAERAVLVERHRAALSALRANLVACDLADRATVVDDEVGRFARRPRGGPFDLVLADPPFATAAADVWAVLEGLRAAGALAGGAEMVVQRPAREGEPRPPASLALARVRTYGDSALWRLTLAAPAAPDEEPESR